MDDPRTRPDHDDPTPHAPAIPPEDEPVAIEEPVEPGDPDAQPV